MEIAEEGNSISIKINPSGSNYRYLFEKEEESEKFYTNCVKLDEFMKDISNSEKKEYSYLQLLEEVIQEFDYSLVEISGN